MVRHCFRGTHSLCTLSHLWVLTHGGFALQKLEREGLMKALVGAITKGTTEYSLADLSIPGLRHFLYKSRPQVQITMPRYEEPYDDLNERRRCVILPPSSLPPTPRATERTTR